VTTAAPLRPLHLPLRGIQLIEASAGTGKTWTIAALYLRLVLGHGTPDDKPLLPAQILVLTFTKAATAELRERIRERLAEAADAFRGRQAPDDFLRDLMDCYPEGDARARAARQLDLAAQWMDESAIHTIHAWCQRMLGQHAFDSGLPFVQDTDADEGALLADTVRDYWRAHFFLLGRDGAALVSSWWETPARLQAAIAPLMKHPEERLYLAGLSLPDATGTFNAFLPLAANASDAQAHARRLWLEDVDTIEAMFDKALDAQALSGVTMKRPRVEEELRVLRAWASGGEDGDISETLSRYTQIALEKARKGKAEVLRHPAFDAIATCVQALETVATWRELVLAHATRWISRKLEETKQRRAQLGFDDMLKRLHDALHGHTGKRLADTIASQYPIALIDEFQDTDPLQWRIFHRIYARSDLTGLLLIGDPKQAIYGFRGADIHTYLRARARAQKPTWTLGTNYRSTGPLVDAVNRVFAFADAHEQGAFAFGRGPDSLPFLPVGAQGRRDQLVLDGHPLPPMQLVVQPSDETISPGAYIDFMARHAAAWLVDLLTAARESRCGFLTGDGSLRPLRPGDIAILVRSGSEAARVRTQLQHRGLKSVYLSDRDSIYASPEAADLLRWLRACAEPSSDRAMRAALATPTLLQSDEELDRLNLDEHHWEACGDRFRTLHATWQRHGVLAMLHDLLHAFNLPARLLSRVDGERSLTNLLHLAELLQHSAATLDGEAALIRHLAAHIAAAGQSGVQTLDEQIVRLESEAALIKVITIHKSKGLEYPLVLMPFACSGRELRSNDQFAWHGDDGELRVDLRADGTALARADHERLQEELRLLYVALTRAQYACWLGAACVAAGKGNNKAPPLHRSAFGYVLSGGAKIEPGDLLLRMEALRGDQEGIAIRTLGEPGTHPLAGNPSDVAPLWEARTYQGPSAERWRVSSYSGLKYAEAEETRVPAPETATQDTLIEASVEQPAPSDSPTSIAHGIHAFHAGAEAGTFLHDLLEWAADEGFATAADNTQALEKEIARRCQRRGWQAHIPMLTAWMADFLRTPLALPDGNSAALSQMTSHYAELEFWFEAQHVDTLALDRLVTAHTLQARPRVALLAERIHGLLKGFIDLVVERQGRYYVIDYKSNKLGSDASAYTADAMRDSILRERYDLQYALYTLALHRQLRARLPGYDYERHMGGVAYLYLRGVDGAGHGVHVERLPKALIDAMDRLFATGEHARVA